MVDVDRELRTATLNKGVEVYVIARTINKQKIGKMSFYWYYVQKDQTDYSVCDQEFFWLYGKFVDIKK